MVRAFPGIGGQFSGVDQPFGGFPVESGVGHGQSNRGNLNPRLAGLQETAKTQDRMDFSLKLHLAVGQIIRQHLRLAFHNRDNRPGWHLAIIFENG